MALESHCSATNSLKSPPVVGGGGGGMDIFKGEIKLSNFQCVGFVVPVRQLHLADADIRESIRELHLCF